LHSEINISISSTELSSYTRGQISHLFPDRCEVEDTVFEELQTDALLKLNRCFSEIDNKYFRNGKKVFFNHLNGDQYSMFLYLMSFLANDVYKNQNLASKLYLLNKMLHGIDVFYEVTLPEIFLFVHPVGTVLGRAKYGEFFTV
jgi:serine O-acetyltransferase